MNGLKKTRIIAPFHRVHIVNIDIAGLTGWEEARAEPKGTVLAQAVVQSGS